MCHIAQKGPNILPLAHFADIEGGSPLFPLVLLTKVHKISPSPSLSHSREQTQ